MNGRVAGVGLTGKRRGCYSATGVEAGIPGLVNTIIALFKDTSLVIIIGLFDLFSSVQQATVDPTWLGMSTEGYVSPR